MLVIRRDGTQSEFKRSKIDMAVERAFFATQGRHASHKDNVQAVGDKVVDIIGADYDTEESVHIEVIQQAVLTALIDQDHPRVEQAYRLYRDARITQRDLPAAYADAKGNAITVPGLTDILARVSARLSDEVTQYFDLVDVAKSAYLQMFPGIKQEAMWSALILATRPFIEVNPEYTYLAAQLLLAQTAREVWALDVEQAFPTSDEYDLGYRTNFGSNIVVGVQDRMYTSRLSDYRIEERDGLFNLPQLAHALQPERDLKFDYLGLQTLFDRYFTRRAGEGVRLEMPQAFFMRVAMGLALLEKNPTEKAIEFYEVLSSFDYMASTPTLFNSGTTHSQMSSCYLTTVPDDLYGIYGALQDNAMLSKFAGGLGNDWTPVRALGSLIKGTNGKSQGVVPFLKVVNDTAVAVNQGGKRKGAVCAYLETWHMDIDEFTELRKNTGDDRRRTHDMNTANWVPDLFMERQRADLEWTLFTPSECPDLHDLYGEAFKARYEEYEAMAARGEIKVFRTVRAKDLWRKMLSMLFETGHPWITFKDPCNIRSPQQHVGVVHSSNLCTEITLNTSADEIAVCNLGSINLPAHLKVDADGIVVIDYEKLARTVKVAVRMLDNVIDLNYYPTPTAKNSNMKHRPIGLGVMGFQDVLYAANVAMDEPAAQAWSREFQRAISYHAIQASVDLAEEREAYETFDGSLWSQGKLPVDSFFDQISMRHNQGFDVSGMTEALGQSDAFRDSIWNSLEKGLRERVRKGMRNSNVMAIAPTATISNIVGVTQSIEPTYEHVFVKENLSGNFTMINTWLVNTLRKEGLWDRAMADQIKLHNGSIQAIPEIPDYIKDVYKTAFEFNPECYVDNAIARQIHIDQAQSLNLYMAQPSGKKLDGIYNYAYYRGLKTTYYLRAKAASAIEKSGGNGGELNRVKSGSDANTPRTVPEMPEPEGAACMLRPGDPGFADCEACQ